MAWVRYNKATREIELNLPRFRRSPRARTKYDQNWFIRFLNLARDEDGAVSGSSVTDPYAQVAWVNIGVSKLSENVARAPWKLYTGETEVTSGPAYDLFRFVNDSMDRFRLWEATTAWMRTRGEAFWLFPDLAGFPDEIWIPDPAAMFHKVDKQRQITMWQWEVGEKKERIPFVPEEVIHFKRFNPWNPYRGVNEFTGLDMELSLDYLASLSNKSTLENGSIPEGMISTDMPIDEKEAKRLKEVWKSKYGGVKKRGEVAVMGHGTKYTPIQLTPQDMQQFKQKEWSREAVFAKLGVPPVLAGFSTEHTPLSGDDTTAQMKSFWNLSIIPMLQYYQQKLETEFFDRFFPGLTGRFDLSGIPELQEDEAAVRLQQREDVKAGVVTINEVRDERKLDPVEWGDAWWKPLALEDVTEEKQPIPAQLAGPPPPPDEDEDEDKAIVWSATSALIGERDTTPIGVWMGGESKSMFSTDWKDVHWKEIVQTWEKVEAAYAEEIRDWFFAIRSEALTVVTAEKALVGTNGREEVGDAQAAYAREIRNGHKEVEDALYSFDDSYWNSKASEFRVISERNFRAAMVASEPHILSIFETIGAPIVRDDWSIFDTSALQYMDNRLVNVKGITETIRSQLMDIIESGVAEGLSEPEVTEMIRHTFGVAKNRAQSIARTEIGGVLSDSRVAAFIDEGYTHIEWLSSRDAKVRSEHLIDGEIVKLGESFSNGMRWPFDDTAPADLVINCRCLELPAKNPEAT